MHQELEKLRTVLVTDCGSTTTKALLFQKTENGWRSISRGEAPTTVEEPVADVTVGALNAFEEIQEISGRDILRSEHSEGASPFIFTKEDSNKGIDLYLSTSSAGGGLQMVVAGVVKEMTTESAHRAALGAGAIVLDAISADDGREEHERIERLRHIRPDIVLLTGGVDGGARNHVIEVAEMLLAASPRPRFGDTLRLPVIYAGNKEAAQEVTDLLSKNCQVNVVENVRPTLESENLVPAREAIHEFFLTHVMSHSPGYGKLLKWSPVPVMPTPAAVGQLVESYARQNNLQVLCVDIGGATTDVFSIFRNQAKEMIFNRTVSANLGMSYSVANVLIEAGPDRIAAWLPYKISPTEVRDRLRNKMIRPTSIPQTIEDLWLEQAVCREALRLSLGHHRSLAVGLKGGRQSRGISDMFSQKSAGYDLVDLLALDLVIGSGGVLSHAPNRVQAALMMLDGFELAGITQIAVDSVFMMPHLGVFASVYPNAASEIFTADCLVNVAHSVVPISSKSFPIGSELADLFLNEKLIGTVKAGVVSLIRNEWGEKVNLKVVPKLRQVDLGNGSGQVWQRDISLGSVGLILDGRNRPLKPEQPGDQSSRSQAEIFKALGLN